MIVEGTNCFSGFRLFEIWESKNAFGGLYFFRDFNIGDGGEGLRWSSIVLGIVKSTPFQMKNIVP